MDLVESATWKETFFKDTFSVDQCLTDYTQKSDLETLRKDLKNYGAELQLLMSEILKNETEAIVNLAEYLTNLNTKIDNLSIPISQLREEIRTLYELIKSGECSYNSMLNDVKNNNAKQNHVHLKLGIINSSMYINSVINTLESDLMGNLLTLERFVNKYSFQKTYLDELHLMTPDIDKIVKNVETKLVSYVNRCFLKALKADDKNILLRCLRMYVDLQKQQEAHHTFQRIIIHPKLKPLFTERYLEQCGQDLSKIYTEVKQILNSNVDILTSIVNQNSDLSSFNFVFNSFWKELDNQSREGLSHITAPGNPELFQKRFTSTHDLLKYIAEQAGNIKLVQEEESFQNHLKRFNLPVYFEIKFQQIAGKFESDTLGLNFHNANAGNNNQGFKLRVSIALWNGLVSCFHKDIYIDQIADHFLRLAMMLLSRYVKHLEKIFTNIVAAEDNKEKIDSFIINVLIDLNIVQSLIAPKCQDSREVEETIFSVINPKIWHIVLKLFQLNENTILKVQNMFKNHIVSTKIVECASILQNVTAIPRLYRRTNRNPPKDASSYMIEALKPVLKFENRFKNDLEEQINDIVNSIIMKLTNQYLSLVQEVLMSVSKTEESLRRLKSRTLNTSGDDSSHGATDTMSDERKIREQIKYDVGYFTDKLYPLAMQSAKDAMMLLKNEVI